MDPILGAEALKATTGFIQNGIERLWNLNDYKRQRADALADWNRVNEYNSPIAQMTRYKEAGLNPNLIYGQMQNASPMRGPSINSSKMDNPFSSLGSAIIQKLNLENATKNLNKDLAVKEANIRNLNEEANNKELIGEGLVQENRIKAITANTLSELEPEYKESMKSSYLNNQINYLSNNLNYQVQNALKETNIAKAAQELVNLKLNGNISEETKKKIQQEYENLKNSNEIQKMDMQFKQLGVGQNDNVLLRLGTRILYKYFPSIFE